MSKIQVFIACFVSVATGILFIGAISYSIGPESPTNATLWQILLSAALCALATAVFFPDEHAGKLRTWVGIGLHFVSLCIIMVCCGRWFGWIGPSVLDAAVMVGYVVLVYAFTTGVGYLLSKQQTDEMNRQLRKKYHSATADDSQEEK